MLGLAGIPMSVAFAFLDPADGAPAAAVGDLTVGALDDVDAAQRMAKGADVVTYEWEGVPADEYQAFLDEQRTKHQLTEDDLKNWRPAPTRRGRRGTAKETQQ